jgi:hypothetical protein
MIAFLRWARAIGAGAGVLVSAVHAQPGLLKPQLDRLGQSQGLRLQAEQKAYTESLKPLTPPQRAGLQQRLQQQQFEQRQLQQQQVRQGLLLQQRLGALPDANVVRAQARETQQAERQQRQLDLQQQMQRGAWSYPRWWQGGGAEPPDLGEPRLEVLQ